MIKSVEIRPETAIGVGSGGLILKEPGLFAFCSFSVLYIHPIAQYLQPSTQAPPISTPSILQGHHLFGITFFTKFFTKFLAGKVSYD